MTEKCSTESNCGEDCQDCQDTHKVVSLGLYTIKTCATTRFDKVKNFKCYKELVQGTQAILSKYPKEKLMEIIAAFALLEAAQLLAEKMGKIIMVKVEEDDEGD